MTTRATGVDGRWRRRALGAALLLVLALILGIVLETGAGGGEPGTGIGGAGEVREPGSGAAPVQNDGSIEAPPVGRSGPLEEGEVLRFLWAGEDESPAAGLPVRGWTDQGTRIELETGADGRIALPGRWGGLLLFFGEDGGVADGILRVRVSPGRESRLTVFRRGGVRVRVRDAAGGAVPGVRIALALPVEDRRGERYVPVRHIDRDQGLERQRLLARIGAAGGSLGPHPSLADIDESLLGMDRDQRKRLVGAVTSESLQSAWIGFPYIGALRAVTDLNGEHRWKGLPAGIDGRVILESGGVVVTHPQARDAHALERMRNEPGRPADFSGLIPIRADAVAEVECLAISESVVRGRLPVRGAATDSADVRLWSVSKGFLGESAGTSSMGVDWECVVEESGAFSTDPYAPLPGDKMITATWYPGDGQATVASRTFALAANEQKDVGTLAALESPPVEFSVILVDAAGNELHEGQLPGLAELVENLSLSVRTAAVVDPQEGRQGVPPSFFRVPPATGLMVTGLPVGRLRFFVHGEGPEDAGGESWSWRVGEVPDLELDARAASASVEIPVIVEAGNEREVEISFRAVDGGKFAHESEVVLFRGGMIVARGIATRSGDLGTEARCVIAVEPGVYALLLWPSGLGAAEPDPSDLAGAVVDGVALGYDGEEAAVEVARGRQVSGVLRFEDGSTPSADESFAIAPILPGFRQPADSLRNRPAQAFLTLDAEGGFRLAGLPETVDFVGGGFGRSFFIDGGRQDVEALAVRVARH